ncbi:MAG: hypothetical protein PVI91_10505 [Gammaproteobacteria bacterium]|jgi:hypothetical protein
MAAIASAQSPVATLSASDRDLQSSENDTIQVAADVLLIEQSTLQAVTAIWVFDWMRKFNATRAMFVCRFGAEKTLKKLPKSKCSGLRAPVELRTIEDRCLAVMFGQRAAAISTGSKTSGISERPVPLRRYNDDTLARIAAVPTAVECKRSYHLAELLTSLSAFERHTTECESQNPADAALHGYLSNATAQARHMIEEALDRVIEAENILF